MISSAHLILILNVCDGVLGIEMELQSNEVNFKDNHFQKETCNKEWKKKKRVGCMLKKTGSS